MCKIITIFLCIYFALARMLLSASADTVSADPSMPVILEPEDNTVIHGSKLTIKWQPLEKGQWCQIQVAQDIAFSLLLANEESVYGTEWTYEPLPQDGKTYYWRIRTCQQAPLAEQEEIELLLDQFDFADINGDGNLSFEETIAIWPNLTQQKFDELDINGDGQLSKDELLSAINETSDRCGCCDDIRKGSFKERYVSDWMLLGLSLLVFLGIANKRKLF